MTTLVPSFLTGTSPFLQETRTCIKAWMSSNFNQIRPLTTELPALERLKKSMFNLVNTLAPSFLIGSFSFLQVTRTTIMSCMSSKFSQIKPWTAELDAIDLLKKSFTYLRTIKKNLMTCWLSGERSLPFGLLVQWSNDFARCLDNLEDLGTFSSVSVGFK